MGVSVVIAGGGTAGHIEPALALADALRRADPDTAITCLGTERGLETRLVPMRGYDLALIPPVPMPRRPTPALLSVPGRHAGRGERGREMLERTRADVVVGFGGYVATPGYLAARRRKVPIVVHEANARPGLANRIGARLTQHVCTGQPGTRLPHAQYVGIPIRREISEPGPAGAGGQGAGAFRPAAGPAGTAGHRRLAGRRVAQPRGARRGREHCAARASRCCTSSARQGRRGRRAARHRCRTWCCRTWTGWSSATRQRTSCWAGPAR